MGCDDTNEETDGDHELTRKQLWLPFLVEHIAAKLPTIYNTYRTASHRPPRVFVIESTDCGSHDTADLDPSFHHAPKLFLTASIVLLEGGLGKAR